MRRPLGASPRLWLGTAALFVVALSLSAVTMPAVDGWHDQWRAFANTTRLAGHCSDPLYVDNPECQPTDHTFETEMWMIVPWLLAAGNFVASMAVAWPFVRRRTDA